MALTRLAETILAKAKELDRGGVVDPDSKQGFRNMTTKDFESRATLIGAVRELERLSTGPLETLHYMILNSIDGISLHAITRYNIPAHVPDEGTSIHELANKINFDEDNLARLLRHAAVNGIFAEPKQGHIVHTPLSRLMRDDEDSLAMSQYALETLWPLANRTLETLEKWPGSRDPMHTAWTLHYDSKEVVMLEIAKDPVKMRGSAAMYRADSEMMVQGPDSLDKSPLWREIDRPGVTMVDVGGNVGHVSIQLANVTKHIRFVVQDQPDVVAGAKSALSAAYTDRISFEVHDFFKEEPLKGADVYFFRKILHDWPDHVCVKILRNLIPALNDGAKVVICDDILPDTAKGGYVEKEARNSDLKMMMALNGKERAMGDWKRLFADADPRFDLEFEPWACSTLGMIKATWKP